MIERVNCFNCVHYYVTWDKNFPKGCRLFGFKSRRLPSEVVRESTGNSCENHAEKKKRNENE